MLRKKYKIAAGLWFLRSPHEFRGMCEVCRYYDKNKNIYDFPCRKLILENHKSIEYYCGLCNPSVTSLYSYTPNYYVAEEELYYKVD